MELRERIAREVRRTKYTIGLWTEEEIESGMVKPMTRFELESADAILAIPEIRDALLIAEQTTESDKKRKLAWARS